MEMALTEEKKLMARSPKMEDELNYEEIREATMNRIHREFANRVPVQLKWNIEL